MRWIAFVISKSGMLGESAAFGIGLNLNFDLDLNFDLNLKAFTKSIQ
jgi:hypothetical protein